MAYADVTVLPSAPSRVGDPTNFGAESLVFLAAQPTYRTENNVNVAYFDALEIDPYNWGNVSVTAPTREQITAFPTAPINTQTGRALTDAIDAFNAAMFDGVSEFNTTGAYVDAMTALSDPYGFVDDTLRPEFSSITASPTRSDPISTFDTRSFAFWTTVESYSTAFKNMADYVYVRLAEPEDYGSVAVAADEFDDWGTLA